MTSFKPEDIKDLFNKEFEFISTILNQVQLPARVEDSGKFLLTCAFIKLIRKKKYLQYKYK